MSILNDLGSISSNLRDRAHATKIFVDGNYQLAPKYSFLYYVHIESTVFAKSKDIGMLVKSVQLPRFSIDLKKYNAYNKTSWAQTKLNYDTISIAFHDDNADSVRDFWQAYFKYYYRDTDNNEPKFSEMVKTKYDKIRPSNNWGYTPIQDEPFLKKITIYSLHKKRFSSYALMNPIIKSFQHGEHQAGLNEVMQNSITLDYESVLYSEGDVTEDEIPGFLDLRYDNHPSPLTPAGGGTASILGTGGILETVSQVGKDISAGNFNIGTAFRGIQGLRNASSMDLKGAAVSELLDIGKNILRGNDVTKNIFVPSFPNSVDNKIGNFLNISNTVSQGISSGAKWLSGSIGAIGKPVVDRINQEVTDATSFLSGVAPKGITNPLPKIGLLLNLPDISRVSPLLTLNTERTPQLANSMATTSAIKSNSEIQLNQATGIRSPLNQGSLNSPQLKSSLQYNLNSAMQNKIDLQVEISKIADQQQMILDSISVLTNKKEYLVDENATNNFLLIKQLSMQIDQQHTMFLNNEEIVNTKNKLVSQVNEKIKLLNAKLSGLT
jgi:hypothetical protein